MVGRSTLPLFPSDDGWPYPDSDGQAVPGEMFDDDIDLDALELHADRHVFDALTPQEREAIDRRFGHSESMKELARHLECTHAEAAVVLGHAIEKVRRRLLAT